MSKKIVIIFFIFLSKNIMAEHGNKKIPIVKPVSNEIPKSASYDVKYLCKGKLLDRKEVSAKFHEECEKTIINDSSGTKVEMINHINRKDVGEFIFYEVVLIYDFLAFIDIFYFEAIGSQVINLLTPKEIFKITSAKPVFSPDKKYFLINGEFDPFYHKANEFSTKLFKVDDHKIINELEIRYSEGDEYCKEAKKCSQTSYAKEGVLNSFNWETNNKLVSKQCKIADDETEPLITSKCHDVWIEKVNNEWKLSWEKGSGK